VKGKWSPTVPGTSPPATSPDISDADKSQLIRLARGTLTRAVESGQLPTPEELGIEVTPAMKRISGAFVTLHKDGELRGCVGEVFPSRPLYRCVMLQAINAGLQDHRFPAVALSELGDITFEISVLTPARPVASASEIRIGRHGIVLKKAGRSALFLPQVAVEQGWDLDTTLSHLSVKAGLPEDAWREGATFEVFEAIVFGEHETSAKRAEH